MYKSLFVLLIVGCVRAPWAPWAPAASPGPLATRVVVRCAGDHHYTVGESGEFYLLRATTVPYYGYHEPRTRVHVEGQDRHDMPSAGQTIEVAGPAQISVVGCKKQSDEDWRCRSRDKKEDWQVACTGNQLTPTMKFRRSDADPWTAVFEAYEVEPRAIPLADERKKGS